MAKNPAKQTASTSKQASHCVSAPPHTHTHTHVLSVSHLAGGTVLGSCGTFRKYSVAGARGGPLKVNV